MRGHSTVGHSVFIFCRSPSRVSSQSFLPRRLMRLQFDLLFRPYSSSSTVAGHVQVLLSTFDSEEPTCTCVSRLSLPVQLGTAFCFTVEGRNELCRHSSSPRTGRTVCPSSTRCSFVFELVPNADKTSFSGRPYFAHKILTCAFTKSTLTQTRSTTIFGGRKSVLARVSQQNTYILTRTQIQVLIITLYYV